MTDPSPVLIEYDPSQAPGDEVPSLLIAVPVPTAVVEVLPQPDLVEIVGPGVQGPPGPASVVPGPPGPQGDPGPIGLSQQPLRVPFDAPSSIWHYVHNLGFPPVVVIEDSAGTLWDTDVVSDAVSVTATFSAPFSGVMWLYA